MSRAYGVTSRLSLREYLESHHGEGVTESLIQFDNPTERSYISESVQRKFKYVLCIKQDCHIFRKTEYKFVKGNVDMHRDVGVIVFGNDELTFVCEENVKECVEYRNKDLPEEGLVGIYLLCPNGETRKFVQDGDSVPEKIDKKIRKALNEYLLVIKNANDTHVGSPADL
jgi:hypothetical protein